MILKRGKSLIVVLQVEESVRVSKEGPPQIHRSGDDVAIILGIDRLGMFRRGI
jgi:hypothetical protein